MKKQTKAVVFSKFLEILLSLYQHKGNNQIHGLHSNDQWAKYKGDMGSNMFFREFEFKRSNPLQGEIRAVSHLTMVMKKIIESKIKADEDGFSSNYSGKKGRWKGRMDELR